MADRILNVDLRHDGLMQFLGIPVPVQVKEVLDDRRLLLRQPLLAYIRVENQSALFSIDIIALELSDFAGTNL